MKLKVGRIIGLAGIVIALVGTIVGNSILLEPTLKQNITGLLCPPNVDKGALEATRAEGQQLSQQIVQDGSVLVKNNGVLPLDATTVTQVNVFGWQSIDWVNGGSGSGQVVPENNDAGENIDLLEALEEYGISYNKELSQMYKRYNQPVGDTNSIGTFYNTFYKMYQPSIDDKEYYSESLLSAAKAYSDTALVVLGRHAGETEDPTRIQYKKEGQDTSRHYLEISKEEEGLLKYVGENYEKVIVIVNSTNTMELDFVETISGIDACLCVGATGTRGASAIPSILYGEVSPSGHFTDTYAYDMSTNINWMRTSSQGIGHYTNGQELYPTGAGSNAGSSTREAPAFIDYIEGIYVGYKWYETAYAEGIWDSYTREVLDNEGNKQTLTGYDSVVQYPFGYGMSYTTFDWVIQSLSIPQGSAITQDSEIKMEVRVTNTGTHVGKEVVQVYLNAPYIEGGIEKAHVSLVGFAKTVALQPGENQVLTITLDPWDFASYDAYDRNNNSFKGYELEAGEYNLMLMTDAHNMKKVSFDGGASDVEGKITYIIEEGIQLATNKVTGNKVENLFTGEDAIDGASIDGSDSDQNIEFISRQEFPDPKSITQVQNRTMADNVKANNTWSNAKSTAWDNATVDEFGNAVSQETVIWGQDTSDWTYNGKDYSADNGKVFSNGQITELGKLLGSDYNNPLWEKVLNKITLSEGVNLVRAASFGNAAISSVGKPGLADYDGPAQVRSFNAGTSRGTGFPCSTVLAQTWDTKLAYSFGLNYGAEMSVLKMDGVYGFGCNLHRSAWGGRNYEYFSEDGFLSGSMLCEEIRALKNTGKYTYLKHLALYETEHERDSLYTWCTEQALREIYLKPFQMAVEKADCLGVMSSYNRIGSIWTGGSVALIQGVMRNEWGFKGTVITDYVDGWSQNYMAIEHAIRAGGDILLGGRNQSLDTGFDDSNRIQAQVKTTCKHVLYMVLNAKYTNSIYNASNDVDQVINASVTEVWVWWIPVLVDLDILIGAACAYGLYFIGKGYYLDFKKAKEDQTTTA